MRKQPIRSVFFIRYHIDFDIPIRLANIYHNRHIWILTPTLISQTCGIYLLQYISTDVLRLNDGWEVLFNINITTRY